MILFPILTSDGCLTSESIASYELRADEALQFAKLVESNIDLLQVSTGAHEGSFDKTHPSAFMERGVNVHYAEEIMAALWLWVKLRT